jgi:hypothetical protein
MADTNAGIAYDEAVRAITAQAGVLDNLRSRAATLIAVASLVTSFLGGQVLAKPTFRAGVLERQALDFLGIVAIVAFVLVAAAAVVILWPRNWQFAMSADTLLGTGWSALPPDEMKAGIARFHDRNHYNNSRKLDQLFWAFRIGCVLLVIETVAWTIDLS